MKLSEKYLTNIYRSTPPMQEPAMSNKEVKDYGAICRLEGMKSEAKKSLKGIGKIQRLRDINKQLKAIAEKGSL